MKSEPVYGYYYVNADRSMWASAWWFEREENYLIPGQGLKVGCWQVNARAGESELSFVAQVKP